MRRVLGTALSALFLMGSAYADIVFRPGNNISSPFQNVLVGTQTGMTISGTTNSTDNLVLFSSTTNTLVGTSGHSSVTAEGGRLIHNLAITVPGHTFNEILINPQTPVTAMGLAVTATASDGETFHFTYGGTSGNNFLTVIATGGERISSVTIDSTGGFHDLGQV